MQVRKRGATMNKKRIKSLIIKRIVSLCRYAFFISFSFVVLYPFIYMLVNAVKGVADFSDPVVQWVPKHFTGTNFSSAITVFDMWKTVGNTILFVLIPIGMHKATIDNDIHFHQLEKESKAAELSIREPLCFLR